MKKTFLNLSTAFVVISNLSNLQASDINNGYGYNEDEATYAAIAASLATFQQETDIKEQLTQAQRLEQKKAEIRARLAEKEKKELQVALEASKIEAEENDRLFALQLQAEEEFNSQSTSNTDRSLLPKKAPINNTVSGLNQQFGQLILQEKKVTSPTLSTIAAEEMNKKNLFQATQSSIGTFNLKKVEDKKSEEKKNALNLEHQLGAFTAVRKTSNALRPLEPKTEKQEKTDKYTGTGKSYGSYLEEEKAREIQQSLPKAVDPTASVADKKTLFENLNKKEEPKTPIFSYKTNNTNNTNKKS